MSEETKSKFSRGIAAAVLVCALAPAYASAQVIFSEVMYDLPGSDEGREWIEIQNVGNLPVDISKWKFREANTDHKLSSFSGGSNVSPKGFAVIAATPSKFMSDNPHFSGAVLDSSFSFSNTGESLSLKDEKSLEVVSISYSASLGASGTGESLQMIGGVLSPSIPTPGAPNQMKRKEVVSKETQLPKTEVKNTTGKNSVKKENILTLSASTSPALASSAQSPEKAEENDYRWFVLGGTLIFVSVGALIYLRRGSRSKTGYEIIE